jgi:hypothetical protein
MMIREEDHALNRQHREENVKLEKSAASEGSTRSTRNTAMVITQEFLVLSSDEHLRVLGVEQLPPGVEVGPDARRLRVLGPLWIKPPRPEMTMSQWEAWQSQLRSAGFTVSIEPFWTSAPSGNYQPLEAVADELLGQGR